MNDRYRSTMADGAASRPSLRWRTLPERPRPEDLVAGHRDPAVPGSILTAPDARQEFFIRHAAG